MTDDVTEVVDSDMGPWWCVVCKGTHKDGDCPYEDKCHFCLKREATLHFGDMLSATHFPDLNCCERCLVEQQLEHARERAAAIPELERRLAELDE